MSHKITSHGPRRKARDETMYTYEASQVDPGLWMVKRTNAERIWDEALIRVDTTDPKAAIAAAILRGSWA
jgi:hypothetical protein